jgi:hypothetical protein
VRDRGRVPFALIGVLLLVASGTVVVSDRGHRATGPAVDEAMDTLAAESQTALRDAVRAAARTAARRPVVEPANSTLGAELNASRPFRDALRLRIYLAARERLRRLDDRRRGIGVSARLPAIANATDVSRAIDRVHVGPAGPEDDRLRVTVEGLQLAATREGRTVGRATRHPTVVVDSPVLLVHRRVERFERRLDAGLVRPGLARRLTAVLYPIAWARGYAQFRGHPVENVVANRHVGVVTNGAVLGLQRSTFGRADPLGRRVYARSLAETAVTDLVSASNSSALARLQRLRTRSGHAEPPRETLDRLGKTTAAPDRRTPMTVGVNRTADVAFVEALGELNATLDRTYAPEVRVEADVGQVSRTIDRGDKPAGAGDRLDVRLMRQASVSNRSGTAPRPSGDFHHLLDASRTVTVEERRVTTWSLSGNETGTSVRTERRTYAVDLLVAGSHQVGPAPDGPIRTVHTPGGPFGGPNLADVRGLARNHVDDRGGMDALARRAARGELDTSPHRLQADRPAELAARVRPDLVDLRHRVRNVSVTVERGKVATFEANVPRRLAETLRSQRASFVSAPRTYDHVAQRARVGARAAYVDRVLARLDRAAEGHASGRRGLEERLPETSRPTSALLAEGRAVRRAGLNRSRPPVAMYVDAAPSYLTLEAVDQGSVPAIPSGRSEHPLVARNLNAATLPTDDLVDAVFELLSGPERTGFRSAARVLAVASTAEGNASAATLRTSLRTSLLGYRAYSARTLADYGLGDEFSRLAVVDAGLGRWETVEARAAALSNGSAAAAIHRAAVDRWPAALADRATRERLAVDLTTAASDVRSVEFLKPPAGAVNDTATRLRRDLGVLATAARDRARRLTKERAATLAARLPGGIPVLPTPGLWYAMVNAWHVQVRGSYARFVVRVPRGPPDRLPADLRYVRENATVAVDVDGDNSPEHLGRNRRLAFEVETVVAVAVPPRPQGVGDVGERDERSAGWPEPGPTDDASGK